VYKKIMAITHIKKHKFYYIIAIGILASVFLWYLWVYAINSINEWWKVNNWSSSCVIYYDPNAQGYENAKKVKNNLSLPIFVPTKTNEEWSSFVADYPWGIEITGWTGVCWQSENECIVWVAQWGSCDSQWYRNWICEDDCNQYNWWDVNCSVQSQGCEQQ